MRAYHSIIGLPGSGKTTFLAALWHLIDAGEVSTSIVLDKLVGDHSYLNRIVEAWRRCEEVPRTSLASETSVSMHVHDPTSDQRFVLGFPDLSGESFESQFAARNCSASYLAGYEDEGGILLFITADRRQDGITINDIRPILQGEESDTGQDAVREWSHEMVPEQVRLVDLLQFLQMPPFVRRFRRLAIAVSAWDVITESELTPDAWLQRELPLLHQFLTANRSSFEFCVYGVSAQGGNVRGEQRSHLLSKTPSERIHCVGPDTDQHDLTAPVRWLTRGT